MMRAAPLLLAAAAMALGGCQTSNGADWTRAGPGKTSYRQAEKTCLLQTQSIDVDANKRDFFMGCMGALGWSPNRGATIDL